MKVIKKQSEKTYKNKSNKEVHYYNYYLVLDNGKRVQIKCSFSKDYALLEAVCNYEK